MKNEFVMLVGIAGSGKSYLAGELCATMMDEGKNPIIISSDEYRKKLFGGEEIQGDTNLLFGKIKKDITKYLKEGKSVIYDATNLNERQRRETLRDCIFSKHIQCRKECIVVATPIDVLKRQNSSRDRVVPDYAIERMLQSFQTPIKTEGWDSIRISNHPEIKELKKPISFVNETFTLGQNNHYHINTLGKHSISVANYITNKKTEFNSKMEANRKPTLDEIFMREVSYIHDCGKIETRKDGEDGESHYHNHDRLGAYKALFYTYRTQQDDLSKDDLRLKASQLVCYHMEHYKFSKLEEEKREKAITNFSKKMGDLLDEMQLLCEADEYACSHYVEREDMKDIFKKLEKKEKEEKEEEIDEEDLDL